MTQAAASQSAGTATHGLFINGQWTPAKTGRTFAVTDPATGETLATVADAGREDTRAAIEAAHAAFPAWSRTPAMARGRILRHVAALMRERKETLARQLTREMGKPITEARGEIEYAASFLDWFAGEGERVYGDIIPQAVPGKRHLVLKQPVGVVAAITPWNFPAAMVTRKVAPALAAGCTVVLKPAEQTPLTAISLMELFAQAGLPAGVLNLITAQDPRPVGEEMLQNPLVRKITFTGSTEVGKYLMREAAHQVKRISLELGGHAPVIVFDDADLDKAVQGTLASKFRNMGQTCVCEPRLRAAGHPGRVQPAFCRGGEPLAGGQRPRRNRAGGPPHRRGWPGKGQSPRGGRHRQGRPGPDGGQGAHRRRFPRRVLLRPHGPGGRAGRHAHYGRGNLRPRRPHHRL